MLVVGLVGLERDYRWRLLFKQSWHHLDQVTGAGTVVQLVGKETFKSKGHWSARWATNERPLLHPYGKKINDYVC